MPIYSMEFNPNTGAPQGIPQQPAETPAAVDANGNPIINQANYSSSSSQSSAGGPAYPWNEPVAATGIANTMAQSQAANVTGQARLADFANRLKALGIQVGQQAGSAVARAAAGLQNPAAVYKAVIQAAQAAQVPINAQIAQTVAAGNALDQSTIQNLLAATNQSVQLAAIQKQNSQGQSQSGGLGSGASAGGGGGSGASLKGAAPRSMEIPAGAVRPGYTLMGGVGYSPVNVSSGGSINKILDQKATAVNAARNAIARGMNPGQAAMQSGMTELDLWNEIQKEKRAGFGQPVTSTPAPSAPPAAIPPPSDPTAYKYMPGDQNAQIFGGRTTSDFRNQSMPTEPKFGDPFYSGPDVNLQAPSMNWNNPMPEYNPALPAWNNLGGDIWNTGANLDSSGGNAWLDNTQYRQNLPGQGNDPFKIGMTPTDPYADYNAGFDQFTNMTWNQPYTGQTGNMGGDAWNNPMLSTPSAEMTFDPSLSYNQPPPPNSSGMLEDPGTFNFDS